MNETTVMYKNEMQTSKTDFDIVTVCKWKELNDIESENLYWNLMQAVKPEVYWLLSYSLNFQRTYSSFVA